MVKVTKAFSGVPDGMIYPRDFKIGDEVEGELAKVAVANGWAGKGKAVPAADHAPLTEAIKAAGAALKEAKAVAKRAAEADKATAEAAVAAALARFNNAKAALAAAKK